MERKQKNRRKRKRQREELYAPHQQCMENSNAGCSNGASNDNDRSRRGSFRPDSHRGTHSTSHQTHNTNVSLERSKFNRTNTRDRYSGNSSQADNQGSDWGASRNYEGCGSGNRMDSAGSYRGRGGQYRNGNRADSAGSFRGRGGQYRNGNRADSAGSYRGRGGQFRNGNRADSAGSYRGRGGQYRNGNRADSAGNYRGGGGGGHSGNGSRADFAGSDRDGHWGRDRRGRGKWRADYRQPHQSQQEDSSSQGAAVSSLDIPGFYFDPEKKRYFKIQACSEVKEDDKNAITRENIAKKQAEAQRQKDLACLKPRSSVSSTVISQWTGRAGSRTKCHPFTSLLLHRYQRGEVERVQLHKALVLSSAPCLRQSGQCLAFPVAQQGINSQLEQLKHMEMSRDHDQLLCHWSTSGTLTERLQLIAVKESRRTRCGELSLEFCPSPTPVLQSQNKITSICWSDFVQHPGKKYVLYTSVCHTGQTRSLALIRCLDGMSPEQINCYDFDIGTKATWTCSWNYHKQQFAVGTEKGCLVIDIKTRRLWQFSTKHSDTLAHVFSKNDGGNVMYSGIRRGNILKHDLRSNSTFPVDSNMHHKTSVCCLRLSSGENHLYASDFSGMIKQWDLRMQKPVMCYEGLFNQHSKLPFHIDETESLLYAGGQDCYTKIWCVRSGQLLHSLPPPYPASMYAIPAVQFSTRWAGTGNVGLILGAASTFYLYGCQDYGE